MTPQERKVIELALEALTYIYTETTADEDELIDQAITAIKEALAQSKEPEQEPVAYFNPQVKGGFYWANPTKITAPITVSVEPMPLYTSPPQRKPLTDEMREQMRFLGFDTLESRTPFVAGWLKAEAAHNIKE